MMTLDDHPTSDAPQPPPVRPWRWPLVVVALLALVLVATANVVGHRFSSRTFGWHCRHGWPWEYLARWRATPLLSGVNERISLLPAAEDVNEFRPAALAGNVAVGLLVVALAVFATHLVGRAWPRIRRGWSSVSGY